MIHGLERRSNLGPDGRYYASVTCHGAFCGVHSDVPIDELMWRQMEVKVLDTISEQEGRRSCWYCGSPTAEIVLVRGVIGSFSEKIAVCARCYPEACSARPS